MTLKELKKDYEYRRMEENHLGVDVDLLTQDLMTAMTTRATSATMTSTTMTMMMIPLDALLMPMMSSGNNIAQQFPVLGMFSSGQRFKI